MQGRNFLVMQSFARLTSSDSEGIIVMVAAGIANRHDDPFDRKTSLVF